MTVTATKREQAILDVPFSVAAPTEETLRMRGVESIEGVAANVGGLTVQNLGPGQSQVAIRGVSAGQIVRDQPGVKEQVGVYLDESVISLSLFTPDLDLFDTRRVEVLRGPQGTLFGSGSLTGTVRYITNPPELNVKKAFAELNLTGVDGGNAGLNGKFGFNAPLGDKAALRVVSYYDRIAGFIDAVQPDLSVRENVNDGFEVGFRAAARITPTPQLTITPRIVYQHVGMDGWNRIDDYNILANPFTTTRPAVTLGGRSQFTQLDEEFTDDFVLGDVNVEYELGADLRLTSITLVHVSRSAGDSRRRRIDVEHHGRKPRARRKCLHVGLAVERCHHSRGVDAGSSRRRWPHALIPGSPARSSAARTATMARTLPVIGFEDLSGIPTRGLRAPKDTLFFSDLAYKLNQVALFGEVTVSPTERFSLTGGLRYYHFSEDKEQIFDGIFGNDNNGTSLVSQPGSTDANGVAPRVIASYKLSDTTHLNGQVSRGFRLGGINDPLNVPVCTPQDLATFGGRETWDDEKVWNYEVGLKSRVWKGLRRLQCRRLLHGHSVIFRPPSLPVRVPLAWSSTCRRQGREDSKSNSRPRRIATSTSPSRRPSTIRSCARHSRPPTPAATSASSRASRKAGGCRRCLDSSWSRPRPTSGRQGQARFAYVTGTYQHIGSRFTQVGDEDLGTLNLLSFGANTIGGPLTASVFTYNPKLPAYDLVNLRAGVRRNNWDIAFFINNLFDELALLSFDQERGTRARIGFLTNQPRTFGISTRLDF